MITIILVLLVFLIPLIAIKYCEWKNRHIWKHLREIPGPKYYPLIGNVPEILNRSNEEMFKDNRQRCLAYYPIFKICIPNLFTVNILSPQDIEIFLTSMKHISKSIFYDFLHIWLKTGLLTSTGEKWQTRRKILTSAFHFNILQQFLNVFNKETKNLVDVLQKNSYRVINIVPVITHFTLHSIAETAMGTTLDEISVNNPYRDGIYKLGEILTYRIVRPWLFNDNFFLTTKRGKEAKVIVDHLHKFTTDVIKKRKYEFASSKLSYSERKRLAMLDLLLNYADNGALIDDEGIREEVDTFMFEGHDTTSMAICFALMVLANHRKEQNEIVQEMREVLSDFHKTPTYNDLQRLKFMERCLKECLRLYPSVPFISRVCGEETRTATGYIIPKGTIINVFIYDLHHNANHYPDPEKFDPDRFLSENVQNRHPFLYLPFSAGPRNCIGQRYALLEMKALLVGVLQNFILEPVTRPKDVVFISDLVLRPKNAINLRFIPRL